MANSGNWWVDGPAQPGVGLRPLAPAWGHTPLSSVADMGQASPSRKLWAAFGPSEEKTTLLCPQAPPWPFGHLHEREKQKTRFQGLCTHDFPQSPGGLGYKNDPFLLMKMLRLRQVKWLAQDHLVSQGQSGDLNSGRERIWTLVAELRSPGSWLVDCTSSHKDDLLWASLNQWTKKL